MSIVATVGYDKALADRWPKPRKREPATDCPECDGSKFARNNNCRIKNWSLMEFCKSCNGTGKMTENQNA